MMKKVLAIALVLCTLLAFTGCDMFTGGDTTNPPDGNDQQAKGLTITDDFTHEDPTDLDFDARIVLYGDKSCGLAAICVEQMGVSSEPVAIYDIIYGKDDVPVYTYEYIVFANEEDAKIYQDTMGGAGLNVEVDGCRTLYVKGAEELAAEITMLKGLSVMSTGNMEEYANVTEQMNEITRIE